MRRCPLNRPSEQTLSGGIHSDLFVKLADKPIDRRTLLKIGGASAASLALVSSLAWMPKRVGAQAASTAFPDIQVDIGAFLHPVQTINNVAVQFGVVFTFMQPAALTRNPTKADQQVLANALNTIEANFAFSPSGIITIIAYGLPYFNRLPNSLVSSNVPHRVSIGNVPPKLVLEEAVPSPTDFGQPNISKATFRVPVAIEQNDVLFTFRSDSLSNITNVVNWLQGSNTLNGSSVPSPAFNGLFSFGTPRFNFVQPGLPRQTADQLAAQNVSPFTIVHTEINPASPMWMGFVDQQVDSTSFVNPASNSAVPLTFAANGPSANGNSGQLHLTSAQAGDYFDNGVIQHFSHVIDDLAQFYNTDPNKFTGQEPYSERVQYMLRSFKPDNTPGLPFPQDPNDPFTNGGGLGAPTGNLATQQQSSFVRNIFTSNTAVFNNFDPDILATTGVKQLRVGHEQALQRSSRAPNGNPLHMRMDGPGLSSLDVPDGSQQPTLEFTVFVPTSEFFRQMRINAASQDLVITGGSNGGTATNVPAGVNPSNDDDAGLERFISATRRQNFLVPPRRHRAFPLLELT